MPFGIVPPVLAGISSILPVCWTIEALGIHSANILWMVLYGSSEISGYECASIAGISYRAGEAGAQATAQSERIRPWLVANWFQAISRQSMMSVRLVNTELASQ
jgi:hypothetical protein